MVEHKPKKSLGQHWLRDSFYLDRMCQLAEVGPADVVLEVGPGLGTLTDKLLEITRSVTAVEFDDELAAQLVTDRPDLRVLNEDILDFDFSAMPDGYKVVANIPYYLTSHLLRKMLESSNQPSLITLLVQKEVAQRVAAAPGKMSTLSVMAQYYADVSLGDVVKAEFFDPPPKVDSQIVILRPKQKEHDFDERRLFQLVRAGFSERRKKLNNSLAGGLRLPKEQVAEVLSEAGFAENIRAQELSLEQWLSLYEIFNGKMDTSN